jgi:hypothetical protein
MHLRTLEKLGRTRLSKNFFLRDFLHSEIAQVEGIANIPDNPEIAIAAGRGLCENILEPMQKSLGKISIRSAYRSSAINKIGNKKNYNCASNEKNYARHIWDIKDREGKLGATACVVVNSFVDYYDATGDWTALAWWVHDHIPGYSEMIFYPKNAAFNITWSEGTQKEKLIMSQVPNPHTGKKGILTRTNWNNFAGDHAQHYQHWIDLL